MREFRELQKNIRKAFPDTGTPPAMSLRSGDALDSYYLPIPFDPMADAPSDEYLVRYHAGVTYLDPCSWRYYLPLLMDYALRHIRYDEGMVVDTLLWSLRPPDREPPRLATLSPLQEQCIKDFLDILAFHEDSVHKEPAMQVLEEYWVPEALYR
jgi:hypothetical protein